MSSLFQPLSTGSTDLGTLISAIALLENAGVVGTQVCRVRGSSDTELTDAYSFSMHVRCCIHVLALKTGWPEGGWTHAPAIHPRALTDCSRQGPPPWVGRGDLPADVVPELNAGVDVTVFPGAEGTHTHNARAHTTQARTLKQASVGPLACALWFFFRMAPRTCSICIRAVRTPRAFYFRKTLNRIYESSVMHHIYNLPLTPFFVHPRRLHENGVVGGHDCIVSGCLQQVASEGVVGDGCAAAA